ncbi:MULTISPECIES: bifunctional (p)ppGpp synthetase/guanosine-3',5'-bis(diphosphate) 3'-pyrophosphohydrolase [unclassified Polaromonas]|jgi:GTP pyrophosphokinase|uniref:RelA/SpoT family protein n=1 Tax=unclassified Polaromonas TaxID=2638319 RepID=UPI000BD653EA|nr:MULTISPECIES: bifunctional (p)ppGpp synthetase/guanosine-3',5'-bis(diphosphate) 3'-pyrophosphohydrolase [unclassified Polaromonas]OYY38140.1 MAG: guanosine-3',5'-bis(diphosphate) 3'-pyrophosphohydrolase [Polaromonas sp. 35-63-35]OYZ18581.1 MAG: guanosine-3',5'-bis(diphosphate) 3'-pyrophosphohydrolase [Polaromonas sp. 16-63-31]OYZ79690.1 MAG: guanosine-3',5'-bis(diphosphate) 3'-pyrophosphohydrolase [Polaromonas sp. 24-63-21]OZA50835.1 MAG: guanosine-3',5'-bis(diphosphate) 3'-pyrophosphohydrol
MSALDFPIANVTSTPAAANAAAASFAALTAKLDYMSAEDVNNVRTAYRFADEAHLGQIRNGGLPYITHPIAVAQQCAEWKLDAQALMAALLHDAIEDCGVTKPELIERFGAPVAELVDGLTKLEKLEFNTREENQAESFRKMLLAMARDVRVILIKLADRSHNMRTLSDVPRSKWNRISRETLDIYAPIAHRLGLNATYRELQDLAFQHLYPWRYATLTKALARARGRRRDVIKRVQSEVEAAFASAGIQVHIYGREKALYSIYRKMDEKHLSFAQVTDIYGFRIIVASVTACYTAMGVLHQLYKPLPGKFKDYIAIPKVNGYQSLHTTLVGPFGTNIEFQMRTEAMHIVAESGVAAHWLYKATDPDSDASQRLGTQWLQSLLDIQQETRDAAEFWDHVKIDLFPDAVYVFTPKSQIMAMPRGATIVDFAYAIHSDVGHRAVAAKVNGEQVPLRSELHNGDVIEIITASVSSPNPAWLGFVRTGKARSKIRHHLKTMALSESQDLGEKMLAQALRAEGIDRERLSEDDDAHHATWEKILRFSGNRTRAELLTDIGLGKRIASMIAKRIVTLLAETGEKPDPLLMSRERYTAHESISQGALVLDGSEGASVKFAACCRPIPGDAIVGYLGRGEGLVVHTDDCAVAKKLQHRDSERFIAVDWSDEPTRAFETGLLVTVTNGKGVLARVASALAAAEADITHVDMGQEPAQDATDLRFDVAVRDRIHLASVMRSVKRTPSVLRVQRAKPGV